MFCKNCGTEIGEVHFCPNCGTDMRNDGKDSDKESRVGSEFTQKVIDTFEDITGGDNSGIEFSLKDLWSDVFLKHSAEAGEELLISGTSKTTPKTKNIADNWPRPWLYSRVFLVLAVTFVLLYVCFSIFNNLLVVPGLIFIGSMAMPFTLLVLFWETNIPRNISIFELVKMFFVGGVTSLIFALFLFSVVSPGELDVVGAVIVGIVEEIAKLAAVAIFIRRYKSGYILNGILIGAAIGAGFAAFESAGYANMYGLSNIFLRGFLSAGGHVVWAAMAGAAIMLAQDGNNFNMEIFKSVKFWRLFIVPIVLHSLWDMPWNLPVDTLVILFFLIIIAWVFILALIKSGMSEIKRVSAAAAEESKEEETQEINV